MRLLKWVKGKETGSRIDRCSIPKAVKLCAGNAVRSHNFFCQTCHDLRLIPPQFFGKLDWQVVASARVSGTAFRTYRQTPKRQLFLLVCANLSAVNHHAIRYRKPLGIGNAGLESYRNTVRTTL